MIRYCNSGSFLFSFVSFPLRSFGLLAWSSFLLFSTVLTSPSPFVSANTFTESFLYLDTDMQPGRSGSNTVRGEAIYTSDIEFPSTTWAEGLLAIDIDITDVATIASYGDRFGMYALLPSLRISLVYNGSSFGTSSSSGSTDNRPSKDQIQAACVTISTLFPWLMLLPCADRHSIFDLHLGQGAIIAKDIVLRDGRLSLATFYDIDTIKNIPYSTLNATLPTEDEDSFLTTALQTSNLVWGGGLLPSTLTSDDKLLVSTLSSDLPVCAPLNHCIPGLFFPSGPSSSSSSSSIPNQHDYPLGPITTYLLSRRNAWIRGEMTSDNWVPLAFHVSIAPKPLPDGNDAGTGTNTTVDTLRIAIAETAAQKKLGIKVPPVLSYDSTFTTMDDPSFILRINQSEIFIHHEDTCQHFTVPDNLDMEHKKDVPIVPVSLMSRSLATFCQIFSSIHRTYGFISPIKGLLRYPIDEPLSSLDNPRYVSTLQPSSPSPWSSKVCMFVQKNGLHHDITYRVTASTDFDEDEFLHQLQMYKNSSVVSTMLNRAHGPALPLVRPTSRSTCHISLVQPVPQSLYFDLDEVREQVRGGAYGDTVEGAVFRSFARAIDVERPTSVSTQHSIIFAHAIHTPERYQRYEYDDTEFPSSYRTDFSTNIFMNRKRFPYGGAYVTVESFEEIIDASVKPPVTRSRIRMTVNATFQQLLHARYQSSGCAKLSKTDTATAEAVTAGCVTMRDILSAYGRPGVDGTLFIQPPSTTNGNHQRNHHPNHNHHHSQQSNNHPQSVGWSPLKHSFPTTPGCYAFAHLPLPQVHIQCTDSSLAKKPVSSFVYGTATNNVDYSKKENIVKQNPLHVLEDHLAIHGTGLGEYLPVPATNIALDQRTGEPNWDCTPPIPPVPVGLLEHHNFIPIGNAFFALTGAFILSAIAFRSKLRATDPRTSNNNSNRSVSTGNNRNDQGEGTGIHGHPSHIPLIGQINIGSTQPMTTVMHRAGTINSTPAPSSTVTATTTPRRRR